MRTPEEARDLFYRFYEGGTLNAEERAFVNEHGATTTVSQAAARENPEWNESVKKPWSFLKTFGVIYEIFMPIALTHKYRFGLLEKRITALEARPLPKWRGVFEQGSAYFEGELVTRGGGLWLATKDTTAIPGESSGVWRLIVKAKGSY